MEPSSISIGDVVIWFALVVVVLRGSVFLVGLLTRLAWGFINICGVLIFVYLAYLLASIVEHT
jgi:hypothetical protein